MRWLRYFRRRSRDAESARDIQLYLDIESDNNIGSGMSPECARAEARRKFGNPTLVREEVYQMNSIGFLDTAWHDVRYSLRTILKSPLFALTVVLILGLGIGANTAIFTVIRAVLLKPLEYRDPDQLVRLSVDHPYQNFQDVGFTLLRFEQMRANARSFKALGCFFIATEDITLSGKSGPQALKGARVSADFLHVLGVSPLLGRSFLAGEDRPGGPLVAMISASLWQHRFGADAHLAGKTVTLNSLAYTTIGVLPSGFEFPSNGIDVWLTRPAEFSAIPAQAWTSTPYLIGFARLKSAVSLTQARAELSVLNHQYIAAHPDLRDADRGITMRVTTLKDQLVSNVRPTLLVLFGAVGFVLFIACANVASLLLARGASRSREFALRTALGAAPGRLIRQLLAESLLLAFAGGALGMVLAKWSLLATMHIGVRNLPRSGEIRLDADVLIFSFGLSILTGVLFALLPSLQASSPDVAGLLQARSEGATGQRSGWRATLGVRSRALLVTGQIALSMVLLIGAALLLQSLVRLQSVNPGFQPAHLLTMQIALPRIRYDTGLKRMAFYQELVGRVETVPGVRGAAAALTLPMGPKWAVPVQVVEQPAVNVNDRLAVQLQSVTSNFFHTLGIPLLRGRDYTIRDDTPTSPPVVMINESFARRFWASYPIGINPVGQHLRLGNDQSSSGLQIVGIVADVHEKGLAIDAGPELYLPCHMNPPQAAGFIVHTDGDPANLISAIRRQVLAIDREQPLSSVETMDDLIATSVGQQRLTLFLLGLLALLAMLLAVVGIYGMIAYSVAQRTQELGIRRALGAQQADILRLVIGQVMGLTLAGVALGIAGALALTQAVKGLLFHISATDPATYGCIAIVFLFVSLLASYIPARRATRVDPMAALRFG